MVTRWIGVSLTLGLLACPQAALAQVVGTFSWQTQPYCNVITVTVIQIGALYQLTGADNLCGAGTAPVTGTAVPAGAGVVLGMTAALPAGRAAHLSATVTLDGLSGTWTSGDGVDGTFAFNANAGGTPRPAPPAAAAITVNQLAPTVYEGTGVAVTLSRSDHQHDTRYYTRAESDAAQAALVPRSFLGPRGVIGQADVNQIGPAVAYSRQSNGATTTVTRPALGVTLVTFPGLAADTGASNDHIVQVTPQGMDVLCTVAARSTSGTDFTAQVNCITPSTLAPIDGVFFITVMG